MTRKFQDFCHCFAPSPPRARLQQTPFVGNVTEEHIPSISNKFVWISQLTRELFQISDVARAIASPQQRPDHGHDDQYQHADRGAAADGVQAHGVSP